jgi:hypothetical protein
MNEGKRFSLVYLDRSTPLKDSQRFRNRLAAFCSQNLVSHWDEIVKIIRKETGAEIPVHPVGYYLEQFFKKDDLRDILDSITIIFQVLKYSYDSLNVENWMKFVSRALSEENMGYRLDSKCGVHYNVDEEFERNRFSTLSLLEDTKYCALRGAYEDAYRHMDSHPPDTKASVRSMFESLEIIVKQMVETQNLNKWVVENTLKDKCIRLYENDETALKTVSKLFDGFAQWVDALHNYRHGQASDEPVAPSESVAIYVLSSGSSFLRWLVDINNNLS